MTNVQMLVHVLILTGGALYFSRLSFPYVAKFERVHIICSRIMAFVLAAAAAVTLYLRNLHVAMWSVWILSVALLCNGLTGRFSLNGGYPLCFFADRNQFELQRAISGRVACGFIIFLVSVFSLNAGK